MLTEPRITLPKLLQNRKQRAGYLMLIQNTLKLKKTLLFCLPTKKEKKETRKGRKEEGRKEVVNFNIASSHHYGSQYFVRSYFATIASVPLRSRVAHKMGRRQDQDQIHISNVHRMDSIT